MLAQLSEIRAEILRLKEVNPRISWNVRSGRFQLCDVTYGARGRSVVTPLSDRMHAADFLAMLKTR